MLTKDLLPLIGVVVGALLGWGLNQLTQWLVVRRDEKRAIARAISDLLEIRNRLLAFPRVAEILSQHFGLPPEGHTLIKVVFAQLFPADPDLPKRYSESVGLVAASNPILGFRLRSQDTVLPLIDQLRKISLNDASAVTTMPALEQELMKHLRPHLDRLLRELAWTHGLFTSLAVRRLLRRPFEPPEGFIESLKARIPQPQPKQASAEASDPP